MLINTNEKYVLLKTIYVGENFGSSLQAFALKNYLTKKYDVNCYVIENQEKGIKLLFQALKRKTINFFKSFMSFRLLRNTWVSHLNKNKTKYSYSKKIKDKFSKFSEDYIKPSLIGIDEMRLLARNNNCIRCIVGSDQVWNPTGVSLNKFNFLMFSPKKKNISYAASIGANNIPYYNFISFRKYVKNIEYISVRESQAQSLLDKFFSIKATRCVDPVLLVGKDFWDKYLPSFSYKNEYVFCYFLNNPSASALELINLLKEQGQHIINLSRTDIIERITGESRLDDIDPFQFISYIKNAKKVLTDSFHGMVFSIIFHREFFVFQRDYLYNMPQPSRIVPFLKEVGIEDRYIENDLDESIVNSIIDYTKADKKLDDMINKSRIFLDEVMAK